MQNLLLAQSQTNCRATGLLGTFPLVMARSYLGAPPLVMKSMAVVKANTQVRPNSSSMMHNVWSWLDIFVRELESIEDISLKNNTIWCRDQVSKCLKMLETLQWPYTAFYRKQRANVQWLIHESARQTVRMIVSLWWNTLVVDQLVYRACVKLESRKCNRYAQCAKGEVDLRTRTDVKTV